MANIIGIKNHKDEIYIQIKKNKNTLKLLNKVSLSIFKDEWTIEEEYIGKLRDNQQFSHKENKKYLQIISIKDRIHITILGIKNNKEILDLIKTS